MSKLYFVEKPSQMNDIANAVAEDGDIFVILPCISGYKFDYPRNLAYSNIPEIRKKVGYKINSGNMLFDSPIKQWKAGKLEDLSVQPIKYLKNIHRYENERKAAILEVKKILDSSKNWILATDIDHSGTRGFDLFFEVFLNSYLFEFNFTTVQRLNLSGMDEKSIKNSMLYLDDINPKTKESTKKVINDALQNSYKNKDFFDYNFNINSLLVYGDALKIVGGYSQNVILTHFMLKTILMIKEENEMSDIKIHRRMDKERIGSPASRQKIVEEIYEMGLIEKRISKSKGKRWVISTEGTEFIDMIHNKINSMKTMEIVEDIEKMKHNDFQDKYSKKISVFFKKQHNKIKRKMLEQLEFEEDE